MRYYTFILLLFSGTAFAQPNLTGVSAALSKGDATALSQYFDANLEIVTKTIDGSYSKAQATTLLKEFFATSKASGFSISSSGAARDKGSHYCIGKLVAGGKNYRINIFFKEVNSAFLIKEMRIEED
jgi:hypothetical protein